MMQNARVTAFIVSQLLRETQQKVKLPPGISSNFRSVLSFVKFFLVLYLYLLILKQRNFLYFSCCKWNVTCNINNLQSPVNEMFPIAINA